jgi:zinc protease
MGQPAIARTSPDYDAFAMLVQILGGQGDFESRLWQELRQKRGLVYGVGADLNSNASRGDVSVSLSANSANVMQSVKIVRGQLELLQRQPVSPTELLEARTRLVNSALLSEESISGQADELQNIAVNDLPLNYYQTLAQRYDRVTAKDIERVAKKYLRPDKLIEIFTGPPGPWSH